MPFIHLASLNDLQTRKLICVKTGAYRILIALAEGEVYAIDDMCSHEDASLNKGSLHADIGIQQDVRATPLPDDLPPAPESEDVSAAFDAEALAKMAADAGLAALNGERGSSYDALLYSAAIALWHLKKADNIQQAAETVRAVLDNGNALKHFNNAP